MPHHPPHRAPPPPSAPQHWPKNCTRIYMQTLYIPNPYVAGSKSSISLDIHTHTYIPHIHDTHKTYPKLTKKQKQKTKINEQKKTQQNLLHISWCVSIKQVCVCVFKCGYTYGIFAMPSGSSLARLWPYNLYALTKSFNTYELCIYIYIRTMYIISYVVNTYITHINIRIRMCQPTYGTQYTCMFTNLEYLTPPTYWDAIRVWPCIDHTVRSGYSVGTWIGNNVCMYACVYGGTHFVHVLYVYQRWHVFVYVCLYVHA